MRSFLEEIEKEPFKANLVWDFTGLGHFQPVFAIHGGPSLAYDWTFISDEQLGQICCAQLTLMHCTLVSARPPAAQLFH